ncbi:homoserine dehydrogenase [Halobacillus litoralis]|uniref:Homoserine dehydrogenase n=1 Tax=Halobacillus litoralis TaxID=45668 RepID=A0A410MEE2_9BACI|nr:homoserine dehydrogenase [Halobacillus litoralis]QAS53102.1 homoserine dehydrogenase [Halobacillus litoralis]
MTIKVAFIGFGGVGQALAEIFIEKKKKLINAHDMEVSVVAVADLMKGSVYRPGGLEVKTVLECVRNDGSVETYPDDHQTIKGWSSIETIERCNADVIVEVTYTDVQTGEPAITHCHRAFEKGKSVITTNKGPVALAYKELTEKAEANNVFFGFEGTVMSGTPALRLPVETLAGNHIKEIKGILNGTTNFILTEMEKGMEYDKALEKAQQLGYAEADPTSDVEGYDIRYKTAILSSHVLGMPILHTDVSCEGITNLTMADVIEALEDGERWKLIARIINEGDTVKATVKPERIPIQDSLAGISGATNAIVFECDLSGPIMLTGAGAGLKETGFSLLIDLIHYKKRQTLAKI